MSIRKHLRSAWKRKSFGKKKKGGVFEYYLRISLLHSVSITWVGMRKEHAGQISKTPNRLKEAFFFFLMSKEFIKYFTVNIRVSDMEADSPLDILISYSQPKNLI